MLGIADLHTPEALAAAESAIRGYQPVISLSTLSSSDDSSDDESTDDDTDDDDGGDGDHLPYLRKLKDWFLLKMMVLPILPETGYQKSNQRLLNSHKTDL